jgi:hypothetical protein
VRKRTGKKGTAALLLVLVGLASGGAYAALTRSGGSKPPRPKITAGPAELTNETDAGFSYQSKTAVVYLCSLDEGAFAPCGSGTSGSAAYSGPLVDGEHIFQVEAQIGASTGKPARREWTIDTLPPPPPTFTDTPSVSTTETKARFKYHDAERRVRYQCALDGGSYESCNHKRSYRELPAGPHEFCVQALDRAGNASPAACFSWLIQGSGVDFSISGGPPAGRLLYPGGSAVAVDLVFTNPNATPITVQSVTVSVNGTSAHGCGAENFRVIQQLNATPTVPAGSTKTLEELGVAEEDWPQLQMADAGDQDACQNAVVNLAYSGTATG